MFKKTWWKGIISDQGFAVDLKPPHTLEYREGDKLLKVYIDLLVGDPSIDIDSSSIRSWQPPYQNELMPTEREQQILRNICAALDFAGITYVVR